MKSCDAGSRSSSSGKQLLSLRLLGYPSFGEAGTPWEFLDSGVDDDFLANFMTNQLISQLPKQFERGTRLLRNRTLRGVGEWPRGLG